MLITKELEVVELGHKIQSDIQREMEKNQREFYLRQQLRAIQEELGETDPQQAETNELRKKIDEAKHARGREEGGRPRTRPPLESADRPAPSTASSARTSIGSCSCRGASRPPIRSTSRSARAILDEDHYDLEKIKDRIVEYLAVGKLKNKLTGPILCFVGPPGVGKTSLGQSIAQGDGPQVRAPLGRRRARRSRDSRPSPHLHRRDAGHDRARAARCRHEQSGHDDRRDRQGRRATIAAIRSRRCSKCSIPSRTTRSATTTSICRSTSRKCCSSARPTRSTRSRGAAARPHGDHLSSRATPRWRSCRSPSATSCRSSARPTACARSQVADQRIRRSRTIINDYTREAGVRNLEREIGTVLPQGRAQDRRGSRATRRA